MLKRQRLWLMPNDHWLVIWIRMIPDDHLAFLDWTERNGIPLWEHPNRPGDQWSELRGIPEPLDLNRAKESVHRWSMSQTRAAWYLTENNDDFNLLIRMRWA